MNEPENSAPDVASGAPPQTEDAALKECQKLIEHFHKKANKSKNLYRRLKYSSIALAVSVTVLSALSAVQQTFPWVVPVVSGLTALATALLGATNAQEIWVRSRTAEQQLTAEKFLYLQSAGRYANSSQGAKARLFSERIVEIWAGSHEAWEQVAAQVTGQ
jgi:hypothetical protein